MAFWDARGQSVDAQGERGALSRPLVFVRVVGLSMSLSAVKGGGGSERPNSDFSSGVPTTAARRRHADRFSTATADATAPPGGRTHPTNGSNPTAGTQSFATCSRSDTAGG